MSIEANGAWLSPRVFLGIAVVMAVLGAADLLVFVVDRNASELGVGLVCLGAASVSLAGFAAARRAP